MNRSAKKLSVVQINNALRRRECAYLRTQQGIIPVLESRTRQGAFQIKTEEGTWMPADQFQVFILRPLKSCVLLPFETSPKARTTKHNIELAFHLLRHQSCRAVDDIAGTWEDAFKKAARWSNISQQPATIISLQSIHDVSFNQDGELILPLLCAWQGNLTLLQACLQANDLVVTVSEQPFTETWNRLVIERKHA